MTTHRRTIRFAEWQVITAITFAAALVRFAQLGAKGLRYDEAATALMARATPAAIVQFHWTSAFEHMPLWALLIEVTSRWFGQSEFALRFPSALAGVLTVPLLWALLKTAGVPGHGTRVTAAVLVALGPLLVLYSQDARMYAMVTMLAVASVYLCARLLTRPHPRLVVALVLVNWAMLGFQYYSVLLIGVEGLFILIRAAIRRELPLRLLAGIAASLVPLALWMALAPSFHTTLQAVLSSSGAAAHLTWAAFLDKMWREMTVGLVRYQPREAVMGYLLLPPCVGGLLAILWPRRSAPDAWRSGRALCALIATVPLLLSLAFPDQVSSRYLLFMVPFLYVMAALAIGWLWGKTRIGASLAMVAVLGVSLWSLRYYFGPYEKMGYRDMAVFLRSHASSDDAIAIEAPRQHLLARYYLPGTRLYPVPDIQLPDYWPANAPRVVPAETDGYLQGILRDHGNLWLVLSGEDEVDRQEFAQSYLMAISYLENCWPWVGVRLCHFVAPDAAPAALAIQPGITFGPDMALEGARLAAYRQPAGERYVFVALDWAARNKPAMDYKVTLRIAGGDGSVRSQADSFPIGPLLPPSAWNAGDEKTGYMTLRVPAELGPGDYDLVLGVYDPSSLQPLPASGGSEAGPMWRLARMRIDADGSLSYLTAQ